MIELYIDNKPIILTDEFKATVTQENPFLTEANEYANNIIISLLIPQNAKVYKHINRQNSDKIEQGSRHARLVIDNITVADGTEVIIDNSDTSVEIQILSGMTDIKFLLGEDQKIRDLDLGVCEGFSRFAHLDKREYSAAARAHVAKRYPINDWQPAPFERVEINNKGNTFYFSTTQGEGLQLYFSPPPEFVVPQPYFCFIIQALFKALGYTVSENAIAYTKPYDQAIIVHDIETFEYAKMLPEWTVKEFLEEIENLFGIAYVFDIKNKTVQILYKHDVDERNPTSNWKTIDLEVLDDYKRNIDEENRLDIKVANVGYDFESDDTYYRYASIPNEVRSREIINLDMNRYEAIDYIASLSEEKREEMKYSFLTLKDSDSLWIVTGQYNRLRKVDFFKPLFNNDESAETDIALRIIPASMTSHIMNVNASPVGGCYSQVPIAGITDNGSQIDQLTIEDVIEGSEEVEQELGYKTMRLAIFSGAEMPEPIQASRPVDIPIPISYVESLAEHYVEKWSNHGDPEHYYGEKGMNPFRLSHLDELIYSKTEEVDTTQEFVFKFKKPKNFNIRNIFNIRNKEYLCAKIETEASIKGYDLLTTGYFYPRVEK